MKQLEIRYQLEASLQDKKKCVEYLVLRLNQIQEGQRLMMDRPPVPGKSGGVQMEQKAIDELVDVTLKSVKWKFELEQINDQLAAKNKK